MRGRRVAGRRVCSRGCLCVVGAFDGGRRLPWCWVCLGVLVLVGGEGVGLVGRLGFGGMDGVGWGFCEMQVRRVRGMMGIGGD